YVKLRQPIHANRPIHALRKKFFDTLDQRYFLSPQRESVQIQRMISKEIKLHGRSNFYHHAVVTKRSAHQKSS
ncbi:hypothetical protein ACE3LY_25830, partial [Enterobacter hormaechei subsp. xiangfangensis]